MYTKKFDQSKHNGGSNQEVAGCYKLN